jgi:hypothetical protein
MGKQSKFSLELVQQILEEIEKTGSDRSGYEAGGISADTFYKWLKQKPEFAEGVASAREQFRKKAPEALRNKFPNA